MAEVVRPEMPAGIGPHEGRELELMLSGEKPLAMFVEIESVEFDWPDAEFEPHVSSGAILKREFFSETPDGRHTVRHLYFCLPDEAWRIEKAHALSLKKYDGWCVNAEQDSANIGRLLGYSHEDIQRFIDWNRGLQPNRN